VHHPNSRNKRQTNKKGDEMKKLYLSKTDKKIFGVCGGIAETCDIDPTIVRLTIVFLTLVTFVAPLVVTYIVAGFIMPRKQ
jgi:phage shock protein PspC (stress-responsive transcriptional regulator)